MSDSSASWHGSRRERHPLISPLISLVSWSDEIHPDQDSHLIDRGSSSANPREVALQALVRRLRDQILQLEEAAIHNAEDFRSTSDFNETLCERVSELCTFNCTMGVDLAEARATIAAHLKELRETRCILILFVVFVGVLGSIIYPRIS